MKYVIYTLSDGIESRSMSNKNQKLASFKKGIKREETAYPTLKGERYFERFSRSLYITAKSHGCEQVLDPDYTPSNAENFLFEAKQIFMFSLFDKHLLTGENHCQKICAVSMEGFSRPYEILFSRCF